MSHNSEPIARKGPPMSDSSSSFFSHSRPVFDQMCHDIMNPLMVIRGRAQLTERMTARLPELSDAERQRMLANLVEITLAVTAIVQVMDGWGESFEAGEAEPAPRR